MTGGGTTIQATGETMVGTTEIRCILAIPVTAPAGWYTLHVGSASKAMAFRVTGESIEHVIPSVMARGASAVIYVRGAGFRAGARIWMTNGQATIPAYGETTAGTGTYIRGTLSVPRTAPIGQYTLHVQNPGEPAVSRTGALSVSEMSPSW